MDTIFEELGLDLTNVKLPSYIAIEGCIGVGKTTLARNIARLFNYDTLLEQPEENPFLERFYRDPKSTALPTQLFFYSIAPINYKICVRTIFLNLCAWPTF